MLKTTSSKLSQRSCLVSSRGAASRRHRVEVDLPSGTCTFCKASSKGELQPPWPSLLDPRTGARAIHVVQEACEDVLNDSPYPYEMYSRIPVLSHVPSKTPERNQQKENPPTPKGDGILRMKCEPLSSFIVNKSATSRPTSLHALTMAN